MKAKPVWERWGEDLYRVNIPLPFPLRNVNSYLLRGEKDFTLIDPGIRTAEAEAAWTEALEQIGIGWRDIGKIVLTHHHPDHLGLAGWWQERAGAPVYLSAEGKRQAEYFWGEAREGTAEHAAMYARHGVDAQTVERLVENMNGFVPLVSPLPDTVPIGDGEAIDLGGRRFVAIHTPGHAFGHRMFFDEGSGDLFCGDHVLPRITPNIGWLPKFDANPLESFLDSLSQAAALPVRRAFPGHRDPFTDFSGRCRELIAHHHRRLDQIRDMLRTPRTAYALCRELFGERLTAHQLRFALGETLAHLVYLRVRGEIEEGQAGDQAVFRSL